jgi:dTMP kinase
MSLFITFEGGEGSGKSTQARRLYRRLCRLGVPAVLVHEPGSTVLGEKTAKLLKHAPDTHILPLAELFLFNASRAQLVEEVIRPALANGQVVVCDRFADSTLAYQGYGRGLPIDRIRTVNRAATGGLKPALTVLIDVPARDGLKRKKSAPDRFEREALDFHERVRRGYLELARSEPRRFRVIDGCRPKAAIAGDVWKAVNTSAAGRAALRRIIEPNSAQT